MTEGVRILALFGARVLFGQERANIEALAALQDQGCEVLCVVRPEMWPELIEIRAMLEQRGLKWTPAPYVDYPVRGWILRVLMTAPGAAIVGNIRLLGLVRSFRPTHIHAFNPWYVASFIWAIAAVKVPMIYRAGDKPTTHNLLYRMLWRFIVRRAIHFVADSRFIERELIASGVARKKITVLYAPAPHRPKGKAIPIPPAARDGFRFVYVGQVTEAKGVGVLLDGFRLLAQAHPNAHVLIAGRISGWSGDLWARALRGRTLEDPTLAHRVHFLGFVEDAPALIGACHVHVAPSLIEEAYGLVIVEAKTVARPSVVFSSGGMPELIDHEVDGFISSSKTASGLQAAMARYLERPGLAETQGLAAQRSLSSLLGTSFAETWRSIYDTHPGDPEVKLHG